MPPHFPTPGSEHRTGSRLYKAPSRSGPTTPTAPPTTTPPPRRCQGLNVSLCANLHHNVTTYPNLLGHQDVDAVERDILFLRYVRGVLPGGGRKGGCFRIMIIVVVIIAVIVIVSNQEY